MEYCDTSTGVHASKDYSQVDMLCRIGIQASACYMSHDDTSRDPLCCFSYRTADS